MKVFFGCFQFLVIQSQDIIGACACISMEAVLSLDPSQLVPPYQKVFCCCLKFLIFQINMEKRIVLELRGEERSQCTSLDLSECKTGGEWEVRLFVCFKTRGGSNLLLGGLLTIDDGQY